MRNSMFVTLIWMLLWCPFVTAFAFQTNKIKVGDKVPWADFHWGFNPPQYVNVPMHVASRNVLIVGVQGAWLPQSEEIARSYIERSETLNKVYGIDEVLLYAVNDGGVMGIWQKSALETTGSIVTCFADPAADFTQQCGFSLVDEVGNGLLGRCPNFVLHVEDCVVKHIQECDGDIQSICAPSIMNVLHAQASTIN